MRTTAFRYRSPFSLSKKSSIRGSLRVLCKENKWQEVRRRAPGRLAPPCRSRSHPHRHRRRRYSRIEARGLEKKRRNFARMYCLRSTSRCTLLTSISLTSCYEITSPAATVILYGSLRRRTSSNLILFIVIDARQNQVSLPNSAHNIGRDFMKRTNAASMSLISHVLWQ